MIEGRIFNENVALAKKMYGQCTRYTEIHFEADQEDCLHAAYIGLLRAIRGFDVTRGFKFSTYCKNWVSWEIRCFLMGCFEVYKPKSAIIPWKVKKLLEDHLALTGEIGDHVVAGVTEEQYVKWTDTTFSLAPITELDDIADTCEYGETAIESSERITLGKKAFKLFSEIERRIILDGDRCGLTQEQADRIKSGALARVKDELGNP